MQCLLYGHTSIWVDNPRYISKQCSCIFPMSECVKGSRGLPVPNVSCEAGPMVRRAKTLPMGPKTRDVKLSRLQQKVIPKDSTVLGL